MEKDKVLQYFGFHFAKHSIEVPYFPPVVWIEPTSLCNLSCHMCLTGKGELKEEDKGMIDKNAFIHIVSELKKHSIIRTALFFRGEPLLHPNIVEFVSIAADAGLNPYFHTNGTLLKQALGRELIKAGLKYISISFDGSTPEEYESHRIGANFSSTLENIKNFLDLKHNCNSNTPYVVIQCIDFDNIGNMERIEKIFEGAPVDQFNLVAPHNWSGEVKEYTFEGHCEMYPCPDPWQRLTICFDGTVVGCCNDMLKKFVLGNALEEDLAEIWNGARIRELRRLMKEGMHKDIRLCKGCRLLYTDEWCV